MTMPKFSRPPRVVKEYKGELTVEQVSVVREWASERGADAYSMDESALADYVLSEVALDRVAGSVALHDAREEGYAAAVADMAQGLSRQYADQIIESVERSRQTAAERKNAGHFPVAIRNEALPFG